MKKIIYIILFSFFLFPSFVFAQQADEGEQGTADQPAVEESAVVRQVSDDYVFKSKVLQIIRENDFKREDGSVIKQQNVRLKGLEGPWKDKEFTFEGIGNLDVIESVYVKQGDTVLVSNAKNTDGIDVFYITDFVRTGWIYWLAFLFAALTIIVGRWKGLGSLISLLITFFIITRIIMPLILAGHNPLAVSILGCFLMLAPIIYVTTGWNKQSHIAIVSIVLSLTLTGIISIIFTLLTRLTGAAAEESMYLISLSKVPINFQGLLLAGIMIGTLGVLDDVVVTQISAIEELHKADRRFSFKDLYKRGMKVGVDHISSMTNTLFLAYAGASLPLLLLFALSKDANMTMILNEEQMATEIVRTLTGTIGLLLAVPISTLLAAYFYRSNKLKNN